MKELNSKYSQKLHAKTFVTDAFKTSSKRVIQKTVEATGDFIGFKIADKITRSSKTSPQNNLETNDEILSEKKIYIYISRIKTKNYWWSKIKGRLI